MYSMYKWQARASRNDCGTTYTFIVDVALVLLAAVSSSLLATDARVELRVQTALHIALTTLFLVAIDREADFLVFNRNEWFLEYGYTSVVLMFD